MNIQEQIKNLTANRQAKAARLVSIMEKAAEAGRTTNSDEAEEVDSIRDEIKQIDADLVRLKDAESLMLATAQPAAAMVAPAVARALADGGQNRGPTLIIPTGEKEEKFKGQNFTRLCIAQAASHIKNHAFTPAQYAEHRWGVKGAAGVVAILKAGVAGAGTLSGDWGAELLDTDSRYRGDFIEFLYSKTVYDRLPLREIPANVTIKGQDGAGTGYWVGEKKAIPASAQDFSSVTLTHLKVAALAAISNDLIMYSDPSAEMLVRDGIVQASAQRVDNTFLSADAAVANVSPAGMLNGVSALVAGGEDAQSLRDDIGRLYASFITAKNATGLAFVMYTGLAKSISLMRNALDQVQFPGLNTGGGVLEGDPVFTGENVATDDLILLKPSDIYKIGDRSFEVSISKEATIEMDTVPTGDGDTPAAQSANMVSMFQNEMTAFKVVRHINFAKRRTGVVQFVGNATYGGSST
jgi:hypothetical protein